MSSDAFLNAKVKLDRSWGIAKIPIPPRWEFVTKDRAQKLKLKAGWYLYALTDFGYRWLPLKNFKGELPTPPEIPNETKTTEAEALTPTETKTLTQPAPKIDTQPEDQTPATQTEELQPPKITTEKNDWRMVFLDAIYKL